jgi:hypothetical protein
MPNSIRVRTKIVKTRHQEANPAEASLASCAEQACRADQALCRLPGRSISYATHHSFMAIGVLGWSVIGAVGGAALAVYGWTMSSFARQRQNALAFPAPFPAFGGQWTGC